MTAGLVQVRPLFLEGADQKFKTVVRGLELNGSSDDRFREMLYEEATRAKVPVSLATIYNTLHQFTEAGLLRQVAVDGSKAYFDTNVTAHHHFFVEGEDEVFDIPDTEVTVGKTPTPPEGFEIARVDVVVRLRRKS